ncbi:MAG TPA: hypothetical protein VII31_11050 [Caldimonas sp.]
MTAMIDDGGVATLPFAGWRASLCRNAPGRVAGSHTPVSPTAFQASAHSPIAVAKKARRGASDMKRWYGAADRRASAAGVVKELTTRP